MMENPLISGKLDPPPVSPPLGGTKGGTALGCLLGALIGDAAGATLEFLGRKPTAADVDFALTLPGGGCWELAPGQVTDDGELTLCLAAALADNSSFSLEAIARNYARWVDSEPFDIGMTTARTLGSYAESKWQELREKEGYAGVMTAAAKSRSMGSKANGSLMRISPLGVWGYKYKDEELANFARLDSGLSHPNPSCGDAVACYTIAIASLMREKGDRETAFARAKNWAVANANGEVGSWLEDGENNLDIPYSPHIGFVKIAFTHAFRHLLLGSDWVTAIRETLLGGGDTDTNACIVGGLVGAAVGAEGIPKEMKNKVLNCNLGLGKNPRPGFLHPSQIVGFVEKLV